MTTLGVLALLLFAQVPQGRVCQTTLVTSERMCGEWQLLQNAYRIRDNASFEYGGVFKFEVEVR